MYKVSEVAEMLSVEKVKIFEALIVNDELLSPYVTKERHVSYISDDGVREIEKIIFDFYTPDEEIIEVNINDDEDEVIDEDRIDKIIRVCNEKKKNLKNEIIDMKRQLNLLDNELRHKDDAIRNYQEILNEDLVWLIGLEAKVDTYRTDVKSEEDEEEKKTNFLSKFIK